MSSQLSSLQLAELSHLVSADLGLHFPEKRWPDLARGLALAATAFGFPTAQAFCDDLLSNPLSLSKLHGLAHHLTIGETYFFREKPSFQALREHILPELIRKRRGSTRRLRIWSAGCCTGEEAYSCAILLSQLLPDLPTWDLTILATDINTHFLQKAAAATYSEWSFRDMPPDIKERYFTRISTKHFELIPAIREMVQFSTVNLAQAAYPSPLTNTHDMDLILCRNVLMYFSPEQAKRVAHNLYRSLVEGGWLLASLGEASHQLFSDFAMVQFPNAIVYQKQGDAQGAWRVTHFQSQPEARPAFRFELPTGVGLAQRAHQPAPVPAPAPVPPRPSPAMKPSSRRNEPAITPANAESARLWEKGLWAEAERQAQQELAAQPEEATTLVLLARLCADQGRLEEAMRWCQRSLDADRLNLSAHYLCAMIQQARGEMDEAIHSLNPALYLYPEFVLAHFSLGFLARQQGKMPEAAKHFANTLGLLAQYGEDEILPESDGWTAGRLAEMVRPALLLERMS